ncbi:unnamed protein product [Porites lobata]|uniref:Mitochondria-eating protein C-terminal domain-containing protein n=1 Tax=Porites lobata TaxID=104759 RepID=A0ABN8NAV1_9CNID|nr:unnamed protein product [Porites lobata]
MSAKWISSSNSVRPSIEDTSNWQKPSLICSDNDAMSKDDLIEAITLRLTRLEELEQENIILKRKLNSMKTDEEYISRAKQVLEEKDNELRRLRERNATMAERKFNMDQSRTENTLSANRQSDLEMEYKDDFRDGARVDAIDKIEAKLTKNQKRGQNATSDQLKAYRLACLIFEISYQCSSKARESFIDFYSSMLKTLVAEAPTVGSSESKYRKLSDVKRSKHSSVSQDSLNEVMVLVKEDALKHSLAALTKDVKKDLKKRWKENDKKLLPNYEKSLKNDLKGYIEYCTRFAWRIVTQVPPLKVDYQSSTFNPSYQNESQAISFSAKQSTSESWVESQGRKQIKCFVWPTLLDSENRVIEKGDVVLH